MPFCPSFRPRLLLFDEVLLKHSHLGHLLRLSQESISPLQNRTVVKTNLHWDLYDFHRCELIVKRTTHGFPKGRKIRALGAVCCPSTAYSSSATANVLKALSSIFVAILSFACGKALSTIYRTPGERTKLFSLSSFLAVVFDMASSCEVPGSLVCQCNTVCCWTWSLNPDFWLASFSTWCKRLTLLIKETRAIAASFPRKFASTLDVIIHWSRNNVFGLSKDSSSLKCNALVAYVIPIGDRAVYQTSPAVLAGRPILVQLSSQTREWW